MAIVEKHYDYFPRGKPQFPDERDKWDARIGVIMSYELDKYYRLGAIEWLKTGTRTAISEALATRLNGLVKVYPNGEVEIIGCKFLAASRW
ncbi:MAG: hypothetical protein Q8P68_00495 [Candidatus Peregrinibacteria bacterium]|nr:hypothetical protein [Candidatus Peregrinibacteria bacterium]MDZ4245181.1 hypothetical protein [Candidatus Gracilibacteria bacterium]